MIPLRLKATANGATEPFVVRLGEAPHPIPTVSNEYYAKLKKIDGNKAVYETEQGEVRIAGLDATGTEGDVLLIVPRRNLAHRLIRASSKHNTFLITERCDQLCIMCSQPPKNYHFDLFAQFETAALLAPPSSTVGISGGEPTLFKSQLMSMLESVLRQRSDLKFHVLTNAQNFDRTDFDMLRDLPQDRILWGIPLYSPLAFQHDEIVGKAGAHERLMRSLSVLARAGASVELRTVLLRTNVDVLPLLASTIATQIPFVSVWAIMQLENIGYGRMNWKELFFDNSENFQLVGRALDVAHGRGIDALLYNFPLCTVPSAYRQFAPSTISDWKRRYLDRCGGCTAKASCGGFFEWYPEAGGFARLEL